MLIITSIHQVALQIEFIIIVAAWLELIKAVSYLPSTQMGAKLSTVYFVWLCLLSSNPKTLQQNYFALDSNGQYGEHENRSYLPGFAFAMNFSAHDASSLMSASPRDIWTPSSAELELVSYKDLFDDFLNFGDSGVMGASASGKPQALTPGSRNEQC
jgi:hypothetical protein